jgi:tetratricopeptide (TPR) repeat protein
MTLLTLAALLFGQTDPLEKIGEMIRNNQDAEAKTHLMELYAKNNRHPEVNFYLATLALKLKDAEKALEYLDTAIEADASVAKYHLMRGNAYGMKAQTGSMFSAMIDAPKVKTNFQKAVELKPDYLQARFALFQYYLMAPGVMGGSNDKAKELADATVQYDPFTANAMLAFYYLRAEEDLSRAEAALNKSLQITTSSPNFDNISAANIGLLNTFGYHFIKTEDKSKSRRYFALAIEKAPQNANCYDSMGDYYNAVSKPDSALLYYEKALQINPLFSAARLNKAKILEQNGKKSEAKQIYQALVKEEPESRTGKEAADRLDDME